MSSITYKALVALLLLHVAVGSPELTAQEDKPGATNLFITYRCKPADRPRFIRALQTDGTKLFDGYRSDGVIKEYLLLYNEFVDAVTWDAMVILTFDRYEDSEKWRAIELERPGGLTSSILELGAPHTSYFADRILGNGGAGDRSKSIFTVIPYNYTAKAQYVNYIRTYGVPQFDGWMKEGAISGYSIYLNHHATGEPWDALLLFEYNGIAGLAARDIVKQRVRADLVKDPAWKVLSDSKHEYRVELEVIMARALVGEKVVGGR